MEHKQFCHQRGCTAFKILDEDDYDPIWYEHWYCEEHQINNKEKKNADM